MASSEFSAFLKAIDASKERQTERRTAGVALVATLFGVASAGTGSKVLAMLFAGGNGLSGVLANYATPKQAFDELDTKLAEIKNIIGDNGYIELNFDKVPHNRILASIQAVGLVNGNLVRKTYSFSDFSVGLALYEATQSVGSAGDLPPAIIRRK